VPTGVINNQSQLVFFCCFGFLFSLLEFSASLPQVFFPSVAAIDKTSGHYVAFGTQAVLPEVRANSTLAHPLRSAKISKVFIY
jgi:hypothetical protein